MTVKEQIISHLESLLATVTVANGYTTDIGTGPIYRRLEYAFQDQVKPVLVVFPGTLSTVYDEDTIIGHVAVKLYCRYTTAPGGI
jgi:hypothetical protein